MVDYPVNHECSAHTSRPFCEVRGDVATVLAACALLPSNALALREPLPGPLPASSCVTWPSQCLIQTRNGSFALSSHIVRAGHTLTGTVGAGCMYQSGTKPCPVFWEYMTDVGKRVSGCHEKDYTCTVKIRKNAPSSAYYVINVGITSDQGTGWSSDYYAVVGKHEAVITGKILNKQRRPVAGADVAMFGGSHQTGNYVAQSGPDGIFAADVKAGRYRVWPSGRSLSHRTPPKFEPEHSDVKAHVGSDQACGLHGRHRPRRQAHAVRKRCSRRRLPDRAGQDQGDRAGSAPARGHRRVVATGERDGVCGRFERRPRDRLRAERQDLARRHARQSRRRLGQPADGFERADTSSRSTSAPCPARSR